MNTSGELHVPFPLGTGSLIVTTRRERHVWIRHMQPDDAPLLAAFFHQLSDETRRLRFMTLRTDIPDELVWREAQRLAALNPLEHAALVGLEHTADGEAITGVVRIAAHADDSTSGEFAIVIRDDYQGEGLGSILFDLLLQIALVRGFKRLVGLAFVENQGILNLARSMGLPVATRVSRGEMTITIELLN